MAADYDEQQVCIYPSDAGECEFNIGWDVEGSLESRFKSISIYAENLDITANGAINGNIEAFILLDSDYDSGARASLIARDTSDAAEIHCVGNSTSTHIDITGEWVDFGDAYIKDAQGVVLGNTAQKTTLRILVITIEPDTGATVKCTVGGKFNADSLYTNQVTLIGKTDTGTYYRLNSGGYSLRIMPDCLGDDCVEVVGISFRGTNSATDGFMVTCVEDSGAIAIKFWAGGGSAMDITSAITGATYVVISYLGTPS